jgi:hypothetical protein
MLKQGEGIDSIRKLSLNDFCPGVTSWRDVTLEVWIWRIGDSLTK